MKGFKKFPCDLHIYLSENMDKELKIEAQKRDIPVNSLVREIIRDYLSKESAKEGIDTVTQTIRRVIRDELKPVENRIAKISAKSAVAAAASMYLNVQTIQDMGKNDAVELYEKARKKAVAYVRIPFDEED